jgi:hypothetical protein
MVDLQEKSIELWREAYFKLHKEMRKLEERNITRIVLLEQALDDALGEWEYNATTYKSEPLVKKHADLDQIAHYRKLLDDRLK